MRSPPAAGKVAAVTGPAAAAAAAMLSVAARSGPFAPYLSAAAHAVPGPLKPLAPAVARRAEKVPLDLKRPLLCRESMSGRSARGGLVASASLSGACRALEEPLGTGGGGRAGSGRLASPRLASAGGSRAWGPAVVRGGPGGLRRRAPGHRTTAGGEPRVVLPSSAGAPRSLLGLCPAGRTGLAAAAGSGAGVGASSALEVWPGRLGESGVVS